MSHMKKEANNFFNRQQKNLLSGINTCSPGQIEKYDPITNKADVILSPDGQLIVDVPVSTIQTSEFFIRVPYKQGDPVIVIFSQRDIDIVFHGDDATPTDRMLSLDDAIVIAGANYFYDPLPNEDVDKLIIGEKNGSSKITLGGGKMALFASDIEIQGNVRANGDFIMNGGTITANGEDLTTDLV